MIHLRFVPCDTFARSGTGNQAVRTAMGSEEIIAGLVKIEAHRPSKGLGDLLLTAGRSLGDAVWIGEIRAAAIRADDPEALRPMLGHHDLASRRQGPSWKWLPKFSISPFTRLSRKRLLTPGTSAGASLASLSRPASAEANSPRS